VKTKLTFLLLLLLMAASVWVMESCSKKDFIPRNPIAFTTPQGFPQTVYNFTANPLSEEGFQLGKKLFFEGRLSKDGNYACASCHEPKAAFTTFEHDRSHGYGNSHTLRNAPGLFNLAWYPVFRQDGSAQSMEEVSLAHISAGDEMAETIPSIINKLKGDAQYKALFTAAFGDNTINQERILKALSQYVVSLVSADSKWDKVQRGQASFTTQELNGQTIFAAKCSTCHKPPLFTDFSFRNVGLEVDPQLNDLGRQRVTGSSADALKFRVPSLRNLDFTSYYTHDGRLSFFRMMIQHYRTGVNPGPTVDPLVAGGISMTNAEENDLVAFLRTLNDSTFLNNRRWIE
jgi:cytochrome c peroxidase